MQEFSLKGKSLKWGDTKQPNDVSFGFHLNNFCINFASVSFKYLPISYSPFLTSKSNKKLIYFLN